VSDVRDALRAHLDYFRELGVDGISRDPAWTRRASPGADRETVPDGVPDGAPDALPESLQEMPSDDPAAALVAIRHDLGDCIRCKLHAQGRKQIVFGVGNPNADLMFVGEAPGADEDIQGEPFVGRAGQLLTKIIEAMGFTRKDVYIANVLKCRPPGNRDPAPAEVARCLPYLSAQVALLKPAMILVVGRIAAQALLATDLPLARLRGKLHAFADTGTPLVVTYHPAYLLRSPADKRKAWEDLKLARTTYAKGAAGSPAPGNG
jgi:uracil-DNA glycosylase family 4